MKDNTRKLDIKKDGTYSYSIWLEPDFQNLSAALAPLLGRDRRLCVVTDTEVAKWYMKPVQKALEEYCSKLTFFCFPSGEEHKTLNTVQALYEHLIREGYDRKDMLAALGGGVVGDLTGFAAATYLRGIPFIQIPTTLLSQVDSSIGGKTGVDFDAYKNMVGAFHMPKLVYMNLSTLSTLPKRQFTSGMAEIIKHGLIQSVDYDRWLSEHDVQVLAGSYEALLHMIFVSCQIKGRVVEEDPTEQGIRAWLNFGHTIGHAVEKLKNFELHHGECVSIGCAAASWLSWQRGWITKADHQHVEKLLQSYGLLVRVSGLAPDEILKATKSDKKMDGGKIKFVLLKQIGEAAVVKDVSDEELLGAIRYVCSDEKETGL
ncbi:MAG: 3-dehydroquinate synthase [Lachnospiraceae bacterium]|nr:3-dehydroquinate synthase [Lachnospiraceae bacterium]